MSGTAGRTVVLTAASSIPVRPVRWLWDGRAALGALTLCAGREGVGKSTLAYTLAADLTRGRLDGHYVDQPRSVLVAATEDSWEHTIVPRLMAGGADLDRVFRVDVESAAHQDLGLVLPRDVGALEQHVREQDCALLLLDPLMSRLDGDLDTHKDSAVRQALEPLTALAHRCGAAVLGLIHVNKGLAQDPMNMIMGSRAFTAVARSVVFVMLDPDEESQRLVGVPKNNLGRTDLPTLTFTVESKKVAETPEGPVLTGALRWTGTDPRSVQEALEASGDTSGVRSRVDEAGDWLEDYLRQQGGCDNRSSIVAAGKGAGHSMDSLKRARKKRGFEVSNHGYPKQTSWSLPRPPVADSDEVGAGAAPGGSMRLPPSATAPTAPTAPTADEMDPALEGGGRIERLLAPDKLVPAQSALSGQSGQSDADADADADADWWTDALAPLVESWR